MECPEYEDPILNKVSKKIFKKKQKCKKIISLLKTNPEKMKECYYKIKKISCLYPPRKNENKFIYGKLIEISIINYMSKIITDENIIELDKLHSGGSEYKNDTKIFGKKFSIKVTKSGGNIIIINKHTPTALHKIKNMFFIICHIKKCKLYIFPDVVIPLNKKTESGSNISYKSSIFKYLDDNFPKLVYSFPELSDEENKTLDDFQEINIYDKLYSEL